MTDLLQRSIGPTVKVLFDASRTCPPARVDPNQLELAILNLAINARDAMPAGGTLVHRGPSPSVSAACRFQPGDYVVHHGCAIRASGMTPDTLARAIEPFFSTKGVGKGPGLAFRWCMALRRSWAACSTYTSEPDKGTPAIDLAAGLDEIPRPKRWGCDGLTVARHRATILLVDDEDLVRTGTAEMLQIWVMTSSRRLRARRRCECCAPGSRSTL